MKINSFIQDLVFIRIMNFIVLILRASIFYILLTFLYYYRAYSNLSRIYCILLYCPYLIISTLNYHIRFSCSCKNRFIVYYYLFRFLVLIVRFLYGIYHQTYFYFFYYMKINIYRFVSLIGYNLFYSIPEKNLIIKILLFRFRHQLECSLGVFLLFRRILFHIVLSIRSIWSNLHCFISSLIRSP